MAVRFTPGGLVTQRRSVTPPLTHRRSGLVVPAGSVPDEVCKHKDVDELRSGYKCKGCGQRVVMVTIQTTFMTFDEFGKYRQEKAKEAALARLRQR